MAFIWTLFIGALVTNFALSEASLANSLFEKAKTEQADFEIDFAEDDDVKRDSGCPHLWERLGSTCYLFVTTSKTHDQARTVCLRQGGDLALPLNAAENRLISERARSRGLVFPWIGLFRRYDQRFITVCGLAPIYTNWNPGQPDNHHNKEKCAHLFGTNQPTGKWNDWPCNNLNAFVCELKKPRCKRKK